MKTLEDSNALAHAMVDTVRDALLVLDQDLNVVEASRSFYSKFLRLPADTIGFRIYDLGDGEWNSEPLRHLLDRIVPEKGVMENFELEHNFVRLGPRIMLLNARKVFYRNDNNTTMLLAIEDITDRRNSERLLESLINHKDMLISQMGQRVANSLQVITSILLLKARTMQSDEMRGHIENAHWRVMSVVALQEQLRTTAAGDEIEIGAYLTRLCESLSASMIGNRRNITLKVTADAGLESSEKTVSFGLMVTELVLNSLKHGFLSSADAGKIEVEYKVSRRDWSLSVSDNGRGISGNPDRKPAGLGPPLQMLSPNSHDECYRNQMTNDLRFEMPKVVGSYNSAALCWSFTYFEALSKKLGVGNPVS